MKPKRVEVRGQICQGNGHGDGKATGTTDASRTPSAKNGSTERSGAETASRQKAGAGRSR